jgi:hypothetical protein
MAAAAALRIQLLSSRERVGKLRIRARLETLAGAALSLAVRSPALTRSSSPAGAGRRAISRSVASASPGASPQSLTNAFFLKVLIANSLSG